MYLSSNVILEKNGFDFMKIFLIFSGSLFIMEPEPDQKIKLETPTAPEERRSSRESKKSLKVLENEARKMKIPNFTKSF